jgi:hypothetical protein
MMTPQAVWPFLRLAGLDPAATPDEWDYWQRELPAMFDAGCSLRAWAERYKVTGRAQSAPPVAGYQCALCGGALASLTEKCWCEQPPGATYPRRPALAAAELNSRLYRPVMRPLSGFEARRMLERRAVSP